ncbi:MAG: RidA family protein [Sneathiellaceae bacterium]
MKRKELVPDWPWVKKVSYAPGTQCGEWVYVAGQVAFGPDGEMVGGTDMEAQSDRVFANIAGILELAGASLDDVMKVTVFMVDPDQYDGYARARSRAFPRHRPASTLIPVQKLLKPGLLVEVEAYAIVGAGRDG